MSGAQSSRHVTPIRLLAFGPAWGMPSMDAASSKAVAWMRFSGLREGVDFMVESCGRLHASVSGELPMLQTTNVAGNRQLAEPHAVCQALVALGHDLDARLSAEQKAESLAFTALIEERLHIALLYSWWEEETNYDTVVRPVLGASLPIPLCFYVPWMLRRRVHSQLARRRVLDAAAAYAYGDVALSALSVRLGNRPFFHGDAPTSLDASAFAYLSAVLRCPLPKDHLRSAMRTHLNLVAFCERIAEKYFEGSAPLLPAVVPAVRALSTNAREYAEQQAADDAAAAQAAGASMTGKHRTPEQQRFRRRSRNAVLTTVGAAVAYALAVDTFGREREQASSDDE